MARVLVKQDLPNTMTAAKATDKMSVHNWRHRQWYIHPTCAITSDGSHDGLDCSLARLDEEKTPGGRSCAPVHDPHHSDDGTRLPRGKSRVGHERTLHCIINIIDELGPIETNMA